MPATLTDSARSYRLTAIGLIAIAILGHAIYLRQSSTPDLEMFVYMGKLVAAGGRPGIDLIDNKFPTVGLLMSVPYRVLGANWTAYALLSLSATIATAFVLARGAARLWGPTRYWPTLVAAMVWGNFFLCIYSRFQLEHLQLLLGSIAGVAALTALREDDWRDAFLVGLCAGLAAWCKPNALAVVAAFGLVMLLSPRSRWKMLAAATTGLMIPTIVAVICLNASGTLALLPQITGQIGRYAGQSAWKVSEVALKLVDLAFLFALPFAVMLLPLPLRGQRAGQSGPAPVSLPADRQRALAFLSLWIALELLGGLAQGRLFPYYFLPMAAPAALLFGRLSCPQRSTRLFAAFAAPLAIGCIGTVILFNNTDGSDDKQQLAAYLAAHPLPGGKIWVDDYPRLVSETDWTPASRLPLINLLTNDDAAPTRFGKMLMDDLRTQRPDLLVLRTDEARFIHYFTQTQQDVAASPMRARRMTQAIQNLYQYTLDHYEIGVRLGTYTVWQRSSERRNTATAELIGVAR